MAAESIPPRNLKHDLRTPLNHIIGYCEMLMEDAQDRQNDLLVADLERIHSAGRHLLTVINDFFDPNKTIQLEAQALHHEIRTPLNQIIGYSEMLGEEATEAGHPTMASDIAKITQAARRLLELLLEHVVPGDHAVDSAPPAVETSVTTFMRRAPIVSEVFPLPPAGPNVPSCEGRLLVVDDNELNRDMLARRLQRLGYRVETADNGRRALEKICQQDFDLVLLDILMPEMNGYEVLASLKSDPALAALPVIVISASDRTENVAACIGMGAEDHLSKPFDPVILQARISASLEKKRLRDREVSYLRQIEEEKRRSDDLLHVILPADVAAELKETHGVKPRRYESVGVLFCDIVGFTAYCEQHPPETIVQHLQGLVEAFERLTGRYGLEKIKTIGDSFMATAGLAERTSHPALDGVRCGLAMIEASQKRPPFWKVRVGLHVGPVMAGVVGHRKYQFDVWGDTVNTAARMEEAALPNSICVTRSTWQLLANACRGVFQGRLEIKGKGELDLFRIEGLRS